MADLQGQDLQGILVYIAKGAIAADSVAPDAAVFAGQVLAPYCGVIEIRHGFEVVDYATCFGTVQFT